MKGSVFCSAVAASAIVMAGAAQAQTADNQNATTGLADIVVTAQKRSESSQRVPITLSVVSADKLRSTGITEIQQIESLAPGTQLTSYSPIRPDFFIRGIGSSQVTTSVDHSVGVFVDEVFVPRIAAFQLGMRDAERIEVLKGPQGTLFGRNTSAGAISIITPDPTDTFKGSAELRGGSFHGIGGTVKLSGPISDDLLGRVVVDYTKNRGYTENLTTGHYGNGDNTLYVSTKLLYRAGDAKFKLNVDYAHSWLPGEIDQTAQDEPLQSLQNPSGPFYTEKLPWNKVRLNFDPEGRRRIWRGYLRGEVPLGFADLIALSAYYNTKVSETVESDGTPLDIWSFRIRERSNVFSQELRLVSNESSPLSFGGKGKWVLGAYYFNDRSNRTDNVDSFSQSIFAFFGAPRTTSAFNIRIRTESIALFGQYDIEFLPRLSLSVGGRYTRDKKRADITGTGDTPGVAFIPENYSLRNIGDTWQSFDPKATLSYKATRDVLLYATYSQGFKSGAFQTLSPNPGAAAVIAKPEHVYNKEIGIKSRWLDGRLQVNAAAFSVSFKDLQLQRITAVTLPSGVSAIAVVTNNAASALVRGGEADVTAQIVSGLTTTVGYSHIASEYKNYLFAPGVDFSGNPLRQAPRNTYSIALDAQHDFGDARLSAHVDYFHKSKTYFDVAGNASQAGTIQRGYGLLGARVALAFPEKGWEIAVSGRNLTNHDYFNMAYTLGDGGSTYQTPAAPRNFEVSVRKTF